MIWNWFEIWLPYDFKPLLSIPTHCSYGTAHFGGIFKIHLGQLYAFITGLVTPLVANRLSFHHHVKYLVAREHFVLKVDDDDCKKKLAKKILMFIFSSLVIYNLIELHVRFEDFINICCHDSRKFKKISHCKVSQAVKHFTRYLYCCGLQISVSPNKLMFYPVFQLKWINRSLYQIR